MTPPKEGNKTAHILPTIFSDAFIRALGTLNFLIQERRFTLLLGESGTGKTFLLKYIALSNPYIHYILFDTNIKMKGMLSLMAESIGLHLEGPVENMQTQLTNALIDQPDHCFLFDEVENLTRTGLLKLDTLRQIWDATGIAIVLCGTHHLSDAIKGSNVKYHNTQIVRRLHKVDMENITQSEAFSYLCMIETEFNISIPQEVRSAMYKYCIDRNHGGLDSFMTLISSSLARLRDEWKDICYQMMAKNRKKDVQKENNKSPKLNPTQSDSINSLPSSEEDVASISNEKIYSLHNDSNGYLKFIPKVVALDLFTQIPKYTPVDVKSLEIKNLTYDIFNSIVHLKFFR